MSEALQRIEQLIDSYTNAVGDVEDLSDGSAGFYRLQVRLHNICNISQVSRLLTITINNWLLFKLPGTDKSGYNSRVLGTGILTRPEHIKVPQANSFEAIAASEGLAIVLAN